MIEADIEVTETRQFVKPSEKDEKRFWSKVEKGDGCWLWKNGKDSNGYGVFSLFGRTTKTNRVAWMIACGDPGKMCVLHHCDVRHCVRPDHLFLGTNKDNTQDMKRKGRGWTKGYKLRPESIRRGVKHPQAILSEEQVLEIRNLHSQGFTQVFLGKQYGVSNENIYRIVRRKSWTHI